MVRGLRAVFLVADFEASSQLVEDVASAEHAWRRTRHRALDDAEGLLWRWRELRARIAALHG